MDRPGRRLRDAVLAGQVRGRLGAHGGERNHAWMASALAGGAEEEHAGQSGERKPSFERHEFLNHAEKK